MDKLEIIPDDYADAMKKLLEFQEKQRAVMEAIEAHPELKKIFDDQYIVWLKTLKDPKRTLIKTTRWEDAMFGELGVVIPGFEIEVDGDEKVIRLYEVKK